MSYRIPKYNNQLTCFAIWQNGFSEEEIEKIRFLKDLQEFSAGKVGNEGTPENLAVRNSEVAWLHPNQDTDWLFSKLRWIISKVNTDHFMYDIEVMDAIQYTKYGIGQHYNWHWDVEFGWQDFQRKISIVMVLNDPSEYDGGEFEICTHGNIEQITTIKPNKGDVICFASWMPHRVKPVTSGERTSLVSWIRGKRES